jgi:hypothetical protein
MRVHHPQYLELPLPVHTNEPGPAHHARHRHRLLIVGLIVLAIFLIGVTVTGGNR